MRTEQPELPLGEQSTENFQNEKGVSVINIFWDLK